MREDHRHQGEAQGQEGEGMTPTPIAPTDLPLSDLGAPGDSWRVVPLGITPRRPRMVSEHAGEAEALGAGVRMAAGLVGWSVDVLAPLPCEV